MNTVGGQMDQSIRREHESAKGVGEGMGPRPSRTQGRDAWLGLGTSDEGESVRPLGVDGTWKGLEMWLKDFEISIKDYKNG